tara:strand:- start:14901 stop:15446 length:546 start_codon:yes stop_codon:yes gene_type:complete
MKKLKGLMARIGTLRQERGATDPILVVAAMAVTLVLLVGGSFLISGIITNGQNLNAKSDLDKIAVAQAASFAEGDTYLSYNVTKAGVETGTTNAAGDRLSDTSIGFNVTEGGSLNVVLVGGQGWRAASGSVSGAAYIKTSENNKVVEVRTETGASVPVSAADLAKLGITQAQVDALVDGLN